METSMSHISIDFPCGARVRFSPKGQRALGYKGLGRKPTGTRGSGTVVGYSRDRQAVRILPAHLNKHGSYATYHASFLELAP
jgi:hypothetical protein